MSAATAAPQAPFEVGQTVQRRPSSLHGQGGPLFTVSSVVDYGSGDFDVNLRPWSGSGWAYGTADLYVAVNLCPCPDCGVNRWAPRSPDDGDGEGLTFLCTEGCGDPLHESDVVVEADEVLTFPTVHYDVRQPGRVLATRHLLATYRKEV